MRKPAKYGSKEHRKRISEGLKAHHRKKQKRYRKAKGGGWWVGKRRYTI